MVRAVGSEWLELMRREYPLTGITELRDLGGNYNLNLQVSTDQGDLVVRVSPEWVEADRLTAVQAVREHLLVHGWPIPRTLRTRSGKSFAELDSGRLVEVEQYVEPRGTGMTNSPAIAAAMPWLARLHDDLRTAPTSPAAANPPMANHPSAVRAPDLAAIRSWGLSAEEAAYIDAAEQLAQQIPAFELPRQLVHGDFWANNVHLSGDEVTLLLDLDFLGERPRVDDLALTLFFINEHLGRDADALPDLVNRYDSALAEPLSAEERAALPYAVLRTPLTFLRDLAYLGPASRTELATLRGPQYEWALRQLDKPEWFAAFH